MLPYFRKQESWEGGENHYRGGNGPVSTQFCRYKDTLIDAFAQGQRAGRAIAQTDDYNGERQEGFGRLQMTISQRPALLDRVSLSAAGAEAAQPHRADASDRDEDRARGGARHRRRLSANAAANARSLARKEVLLAGGVINTPQLLMLSGIGAQDELAAHGIETQVDLPAVGKNLQDHVSVILMYRRRAPAARSCARCVPIGSGSISSRPISPDAAFPAMCPAVSSPS